MDFYCVLKSGGWTNRNKKVEYFPEHVRRLKRMVEKFYPKPHRFFCLTDIGYRLPDIKTIPLKHNWPGWWSKIELFKKDLGIRRKFYIDLDTVIVGDIISLVRFKHKFSVLRNLTPNTSNSGRIGSGIMAWRGDYSYLYTEFCKSPEKFMQEYTTSRRWGDQGFIQDHLKKWGYLQDIEPAALVSYKFGLKDKDILPKGTKIVIFHGVPKPEDVSHPWQKNI